MNFEDYLISKKIDSAAFLQAEPERWKTWKEEFEQVHPKSFTAQKLYLINPLRRRYLLKDVPGEPVSTDQRTTEKSIEPASDLVAPPASASSNPKPVVPRPVFKPKPKIN